MAPLAQGIPAGSYSVGYPPSSACIQPEQFTLLGRINQKPKFIGKMLELPKSDRTVRVRLVDTTTLMTVRSEVLVQPVHAGHEILNLTDVAFLIEHEGSKQKVMFDLGTRKDYWNLPDAVRLVFDQAMPSVRIDKDVSEILCESGIPLSDIGA